MAAIVGVLGQGLLRGVMIGAIISLVLLIRRASRPHVAFLGRIPGTRRFSDRERHPDNELIPGVLIFRPESGSSISTWTMCATRFWIGCALKPCRPSSSYWTFPPRPTWTCTARTCWRAWPKN